MSRYNVTNRKGRIFAYGFDRPLTEYFMSTGDQSIVGSLSHVYGSHVNLLEKLKEYDLWDKIPKEHQDAIVLDLPF